MSRTLEIFRELTSVPTAPYYEAAVAKKALGWIKKNLRRVRVKKVRGGLIVSYVGKPGAPALALAAHLDHPAFHLKNGVEMQGRLDDKKLDGFPVEAFPAVPKNNVPLARGVLRGAGPLTIQWSGGKKPKKAAFAVLALPPCEVEDGWVSSRSIDDLFGCALSLEALRRVSEKRLPTNLTVLLNRAEEVGFIGALDMIMEGRVSLEDTVLSIETSRELPGARPGKGPVIRLGDKATLFDANVSALLEKAAAAVKGPVQRLRLTGGTCEATAYLTFGYEAGGVAIPLVNYHNGLMDAAIAAEKVRASDAEGAVRLLVEAARLFPAEPRRGDLRRRLAKLHKANKFGRISS